MNKFTYLFYILVFLFKTGNVLSENNLFHVDNIVVEKGNYNNKEELLNSAIKQSFLQLTNKILMAKDLEIVSKINLNNIKELISSYQIDENKSLKKKNTITYSLSYDVDKIRLFFNKKGIKYADLSNTDLIVFPVLVENENFYLYSENYFYNNWNIQLAKKDKNEELINYILPLENLEDIQTINTNKENLETVNIENILSNYDIPNYIFLIIKYTEEKTEILLKGILSNNKVVKNIKYSNSDKDKEAHLNEIMKKLKFEINELWKMQNLIDVRTPSFLNIVLDIKKQKDLLTLQSKLNKIDLIENFYVVELGKDYARINIKYLGKLNKIKQKLLNEGVDIVSSSDEWKLKLI